MKKGDDTKVVRNDCKSAQNSTKKELKSAISAPKWRRGRDSNPREIALKLISSQPRYDRFDTSPYISTGKTGLKAFQLSFGILRENCEMAFDSTASKSRKSAVKSRVSESPSLQTRPCFESAPL